MNWSFILLNWLEGSLFSIPYNLADEKVVEKNGQRIFNIRINGKSFLQNFNLAKDYGLAKAIVKSAQVDVKDPLLACMDGIVDGAYQ